MRALKIFMETDPNRTEMIQLVFNFDTHIQAYRYTYIHSLSDTHIHVYIYKYTRMHVCARAHIIDNKFNTRYLKERHLLK